MQKFLIALTTTVFLLGIYAWSAADRPTEAPEATESEPVVEGFKVIETMNSGGYSYIKYRGNGQEGWLATGEMVVNEGDQIEFQGGMEMRDFHSRSLNRSFAAIQFVDGVEVTNAGSPKTIIETAHAAQQAAAAPSLPSSPGLGDIAPLDSGMTVATVLGGYPEHAGQSASLRARVMKVSENVMGKNWVTLQDGSGDSPDIKLIATTLETVSPGDTVVVEGVIANDVSLGYGYEYKVLLEEAHFTPES